MEKSDERWHRILKEKKSYLHQYFAGEKAAAHSIACMFSRACFQPKTAEYGPIKVVT